jgi:hypothetical protein
MWTAANGWAVVLVVFVMGYSQPQLVWTAQVVPATGLHGLTVRRLFLSLSHTQVVPVVSGAAQ